MRISTVIPTYNRRDYTLRALDSVFAQTTSVGEIIIVDDGSTDGTAEAVTARHGNRVRIIRQNNTGVSGARLRGVTEARGDWIAFLDSDDEWLPNRQSELLSASEKLPPNVVWLFGDMRFVNDDGDGTSIYQKHGLRITNCPEIFESPLSVLYPFQFAMLQNSLIRRNALLQLNCFTNGIRIGEDLLAGMQVASKYWFAGIPSIVTKFHRTSDLKSSSLENNGIDTLDHYLALTLAFRSLIGTAGKHHALARPYAAALRGLCKFHAAQRKPFRCLAAQQFYYEFSSKSLVFMCAAMLGRQGLRGWERLVAFARRVPNGYGK